MSKHEEIFARPPANVDLADCLFYHTMDLPGHGLMTGEWDLRAGIRAYLGCVDVHGKRVLEIGTASGFVCFHLEREGAEVLAYDLNPEGLIDVVPFARTDYRQSQREHQEHLRKLNNAYWFCHRAFASRARLVHGNVYSLPEAIGRVDIATFGCVLLHLRDPFLALSQAARFVGETIIVTEPLVIRSRLKQFFLRKFVGPALLFYPRFQDSMPKETWWILTPELIVQYLGVLGFEETTVTYHCQTFRSRKAQMFTVVGKRTQPLRPE